MGRHYAIGPTPWAFPIPGSAPPPSLTTLTHILLYFGGPRRRNPEVNIHDNLLNPGGPMDNGQETTRRTISQLGRSQTKNSVGGGASNGMDRKATLAIREGIKAGVPTRGLCCCAFGSADFRWCWPSKMTMSGVQICTGGYGANLCCGQFSVWWGTLPRATRFSKGGGENFPNRIRFFCPRIRTFLSTGLRYVFGSDFIGGGRVAYGLKFARLVQRPRGERNTV